MKVFIFFIGFLVFPLLVLAYPSNNLQPINAGASIKDFERTIQGHIIEQSQVVGTYQK